MLVALAFDLFKTIVQDSEGFLSRFVQSGIHRLQARLFRATGKRVFLIWTSSLLIISLVLVWVTMLFGGWLLIFTSDALAVVTDQEQVAAGFIERVYFTGFTISTLGVGDYVPGGPAWQAITTVAALSGFFFVTFMISFLISVVQKQALRRKLALYIHYLGETPQEIVAHHYGGDGLAALGTTLNDVFGDLVQFQQYQLDQPILNRFHGPSSRRSAELALVTLDEALTLAQLAVDAPTPPEFQRVRDALKDYLDSLSDLDQVACDPPPIPELAPLRAANVPLRAHIDSAYEAVQARRCKLHALLESTGFRWDDVANGTETMFPVR